MRRRLAGPMRVLGDLLITAGVVVGLFAIYELSYTGVYTGQEQSRLRSALQQQWAAPPAPAPSARPGTPPLALRAVKTGSAMAILRIPRLGRSYAPIVVEGVGVADLRKGPGHYPGTAMPGQIGNFVVSGHRTTYGAPFGNLDRLRANDPIVVETRDGWHVYRVVKRVVVAPTAVEVIQPVPSRPGVRPTTAMMTMTTCHPKFSAKQRLIVFGQLQRSTPRAAGPPAVLAA